MTFPTPLLPIQVKDNHTGALATTNNINNYFLTAGTAKPITFPADANGAKPNYALISSTVNFYARYDGNAATVPAADSGDGLGSELNPKNRLITNLASMSVIAPADCVLSIAYYF